MNHLSKPQVEALSTEDLEALVRSTNPDGEFAGEVVWARNALKRRGRGDSAPTENY